MALDSQIPLETPPSAKATDGGVNLKPFDQTDRKAWQALAFPADQNSQNLMQRLGLANFELGTAATAAALTTQPQDSGPKVDNGQTLDGGGASGGRPIIHAGDTTGHAGRDSADQKSAGAASAEFVQPVASLPPSERATSGFVDTSVPVSALLVSTDLGRTETLPGGRPTTGIPSDGLAKSPDSRSRSGDRSDFVLPNPPAEWVKPQINPDLPRDVARQSAEEAAEKNLSPADATQFKADMKRFEERATSDHLSDQQVSETYQNIGQLMNAKDGALSANDRHLLAKQVMSLAADPNRARTGLESSTCGPVEVETMIYRNSPADAANLVAQEAITAQYSSKGGTTVRADIIPLSESQRTDDPTSRLFASQVFQNAAIDVNLKQNGSDLTYHHEYGTSEADRDNEYYTDPTGKTIKFDGTYSSDLVNMYHEITGKNDLVVLENGSGQSDDNHRFFHSQAQLKTLLGQLHNEGNPPTIIGVDMRNQPLWNQMEKGDSAPGNEDPTDAHYHWIGIKDYDPKTGTISYHNGWDDPEHKSNLPDMFRDTQPVDASLPSMSKDFMNSVADGRGNFAEAIDALRIRSETGRINDADLNRLFNRDVEALIAQRGTHALDDETTRKDVLELRNYLDRRNALTLTPNVVNLISGWESTNSNG